VSQGTAQKVRTSPTAVKPASIRNPIQDRSFGVPQSWQRKAGRTTSMLESFYLATHGIFQGLKEQRNLRIHFVLSCAVVALGVFLKVDAISWLALTLSMGMVIGAELLNTAIEHVVDLTSGGEYHPAARKAKDTAAAAVLITAIAAFAVGVIVFLPRLRACLGV